MKELIGCFAIGVIAVAVLILAAFCLGFAFSSGWSMAQAVLA